MKLRLYHRLVVEGEALHLAKSIGGGRGVVEDHPGLPFVLQRLEGQHLQYPPELREHRV